MQRSKECETACYRFARAKLKTLAEQQGKSEYQTMVKTWIEERLRQEARAR